MEQNDFLMEQNNFFMEQNDFQLEWKDLEQNDRDSAIPYMYHTTWIYIVFFPHVHSLAFCKKIIGKQAPLCMFTVHSFLSKGSFQIFASKRQQGYYM